MTIICGVDEVGRGALAGPIVAGGVVLNIGEKKLRANCPVELRDSKKMTKLQKEKAWQYLISGVVKYVISLVRVDEINDKGMGWANREVFRRVMKGMDEIIEIDRYIIDGITEPTGGKDSRVEMSPRADGEIIEVMAASVLAKVYRDRLMTKWAQKYPNYGWETNMGYGTRQHIESIRKQGAVYLHRFKFVSSAVKNYRQRKD